MPPIHPGSYRRGLPGELSDLRGTVCPLGLFPWLKNTTLALTQDAVETH